MSDIHALSGAYAVDALDDLERAGFERHLAICATCREEVSSLEEAAALMINTSAPVAAPEALRERVMAEIATFRPLPPLVDHTTTGPAESAGDGVVVPLRRRRVPALAAAAAVIAALGLGATVVQQPWSSDQQTVSEASGVKRVLDAPDAKTTTFTMPSGAKATVTVSRELKQAVLRAEGMGAPPTGMVYELWLQHGDRMIAAGFLPSGNDPVLLAGDAASASAIGITTEPEGGSPEPNEDSALILDLSKV